MALCAAPVAVAAQPAGRPTIGVLATTQLTESLQSAIREGLKEHGYVEGRNIAIEWRGALGNAVTIWVVRVGDDLYDVTFVTEADADVNRRVDAAYRAKYRDQGAEWVDPMVAAPARAATLKLAPR